MSFLIAVTRWQHWRSKRNIEDGWFFTKFGLVICLTDVIGRDRLFAVIFDFVRFNILIIKLLTIHA